MNKISFAPKDFYNVANRHVNKENRRGRTQEEEWRWKVKCCLWADYLI